MSPVAFLRSRTASAARATADRHLNLGASVEKDGVHFRVWAPKRAVVEAVIESPQALSVPLTKDSDGYFEGFASASAWLRRTASYMPRRKAIH